MKTINLSYDVKITKFYPYEAVHLLNRFLILEGDNYDELAKQVKKIVGIAHHDIVPEENYTHHGFDKDYCHLRWDNKITFELNINGEVLYLQFYDGFARFGTDITKRNYNPKTHYLEILKNNNIITKIEPKEEKEEERYKYTGKLCSLTNKEIKVGDYVGMLDINNTIWRKGIVEYNKTTCCFYVVDEDGGLTCFNNKMVILKK